MPGAGTLPFQAPKSEEDSLRPFSPRAFILGGDADDKTVTGAAPEFSNRRDSGHSCGRLGLRRAAAGSFSWREGRDKHLQLPLDPLLYIDDSFAHCGKPACVAQKREPGQSGVKKVMWATHSSQGCASFSQRLPFALCPQIQGPRGLLVVKILGLAAKRNNRFVPLGGSSVHASLFPSHPGRPGSSRAKPSSRLFPQVLQEKVLLREWQSRGVVRGSPPPISTQVSWSPTEPSQVPLWVGSPKGPPISHFQSLLFSICHFPTATFRPAGPSQPRRVSFHRIGRWACPSQMSPAPPKPKDTSGSPRLDYTIVCPTASRSSVTSPHTRHGSVAGWEVLRPTMEGPPSTGSPCFIFLALRVYPPGLLGRSLPCSASIS